MVSVAFADGSTRTSVSRLKLAPSEKKNKIRKKSRNGFRLSAMNSDIGLVASATPGQAVAIDYVRDGKKLSTRTELTELPAEQASGVPGQPQNWQGLKVEDLIPALF